MREYFNIRQGLGLNFSYKVVGNLIEEAVPRESFFRINVTILCILLKQTLCQSLVVTSGMPYLSHR